MPGRYDHILSGSNMPRLSPTGWTGHSLLRCTMQGERYARDVPLSGPNPAVVTRSRDRRVNVTTHRRIVLRRMVLRSCAVAALVAATLVGVAAPAYAEGAVLVTASPSNVDLTPGQSATVAVHITVTGITGNGASKVTLTYRQPATSAAT